MKKIKLALLVLFLLMITFYSYGQKEINTTKQGFEIAVNYANYKYVVYSINDEDKKQRFKDECDCERKPSFKSIQEAINESDTKTIAFSKEFDNLKENDIDLNRNDIANFLTDSIFTDKFKSKYNEVFKYGDKRKDDNSFKKYKRDLNGSLIRTLNDYPAARKEVDKNERKVIPDNKLKETSQKRKEKSKWFGGFTFQIDVFSIIISILLFLILIKILFNKNFKSDFASKEYVKRKIGDLSFNTTLISNRSQITTLKNELYELKSEIQNLKKPSKVVLAQIEPNSPIQPKPEIKTNNYFYLSTPNSDGSFNESSMKYSFIPGTTIYKFKKQSSDEKAIFFIDDRDDAISLALQYPNRNIEPCCEATNGYNPNATNITTNTPGLAELNNGVWKIIRKAQITYGN